MEMFKVYVNVLPIVVNNVFPMTELVDLYNVKNVVYFAFRRTVHYDCMFLLCHVRASK